MLDRYTSPEMGQIFSLESRYESWRQVELAALDAHVRLSGAPEWVATMARKTPAPSIKSVRDREELVGHDVVAFLLEWTESLPPAVSSWVHRGMTSSDVVDSGLALQLKAANRLLDVEVRHLFEVLRTHALVHRGTVRLGRTHGQPASVEVWGHRVADFAMGIYRGVIRFDRASQELQVVKLSGPTGGYHCISPAIELHAAGKLGLKQVDVATQVAMRDRLASWVSAGAIIASVCEAIATEVRLGQHYGIAELAEGNSSGQMGSSAMPHKRNPITAEKICGLARMVRSYIVPVMEGIPLWHERDLSHSSVDRVCVPDAAALIEHVVVCTRRLVEELHVDGAAMKRTVESASFRIASHQALSAVASRGVSWAEAWRTVRDASDAAQDDVRGAFQAEVNRLLVLAGLDPLTAAELDSLDPDHSMPDLEGVFARLEAVVL